MSPRVHRTTAILAIVACTVWGVLSAHAQAPQTAPASLREVSAPGGTVIVYSQAPSPAGGLLQSSLRDPDGSDTDQWAWDGFRLASAQTLTEIHWRGGYDPLRFGSGGPVNDFAVAIYASIPSGIQPDLSQPPLVHYDVAGNAYETPAEVLGGVQTYDYHYALPAAFHAAAQTKYWIQIEAYQGGAPDWGLAKASAGDGQYFRRLAGDGYDYQLVPGDAAFSLLGPAPAAVPPAEVVISGPTTGLLQAGYSFTAAVYPITSTSPITYLWEAVEQAPATRTAGLSDTIALTWTVAGPKIITVTAENTAGGLAATHEITLYTPVQADFVAAPLSGAVPLTVAFTNLSTGDYADSVWAFGDGLTSTLHSPAHTYTATGVYTVSLTITGQGGSDTRVRPSYITARSKCRLYLPLILKLNGISLVAGPQSLAVHQPG